MNLCSHNHEEICYESRNCPMCALEEELKAEREDSAQLADKVKELERQLENQE